MMTAPSDPTAAPAFEATLRRPADAGDGPPWAFVVLPEAVSATLPRRGRTTVDGTLGGHAFRATLDPDGRGSHWLRLDAAWLAAAGAEVGVPAAFTITPVNPEPEPAVPADLEAALAAAPAARAVWDATTALARVDWIHWLDSAKRARTRTLRVGKAVDMLASGKRRVCCFDASGIFSKGLSAPAEAG